jgi:hypothetical protein
MITASTLTTILLVLGVCQTVASLATALGLFKLVGAGLRNFGADLVKRAEKTPDPNDDRIAHVEKDQLDVLAGLLESGRVADGIAKLKELAPHLVKK